MWAMKKFAPKQLVEYEVPVALALAGTLVGLAAQASWGLR
jgi:hypothetical protein